MSKKNTIRKRNKTLHEIPTYSKQLKGVVYLFWNSAQSNIDFKTNRGNSD